MTLVSLKKTIVLLAALTVSSAAISQTAAQIEMIKKLPRGQQEALAKQYGVDLTQLDQLAGGDAKQITNPVLVEPLDTKDAVITEKEKSELIDKIEGLDDKEVKRVTTIADLKLYGHDAFAGAPTTFAPATDIPVPLEYVIGPGDNINLNMYGKVNSQITLVVDRDGKIMIPEVGPLHVAGVSFAQLKAMIEQEVKERALGISVITTLGELRSVRVFILGEANRPGSYTVSALSTITNALFVSGGISQSGSLRNIQLKRSGEVVVSFDLYDLLLKGDTSNDVRLQAGDVLFVPPIGRTVGVGGEVKRQAIFELRNEQTLADVMALSGGFLPTAHLSSAKINRISDQGERTIVDVDLSTSRTLAMQVSDGDVVNVYSILDDMEDVVTLAGHVYRPGSYAYQKGLTLNDVIKSIEEIMPNADLEYSLIRREDPATREIRFEQFALRDVITNNTNPRLAPRDKVYIFSNEGSRAAIAGDMTRLRAQASKDLPPKIVSINGAVEMPGTYPLMGSMTVQQAIVAAHGVSFSADLDYAVMTRVKEDRTLDVYTLNLNDDVDIGRLLQEEDSLYVFAKNQDRSDVLDPIIERLKAQVTKTVDDVVVGISGQVRFPGEYPYSVDMTLADLVAAAGGLTESAYLGEADITSTRTDGKFSITKSTRQVNLDTALDADVSLQAKDVVTVRRIPDWYENQYIELGGEFVFPGRYIINEGDTLDDLITRAGGFTSLAYPEGAVFMRVSVAEQQIKQIKLLEDKLNKDLSLIQTAKVLSSSSSSAAAAVGQQSIEKVVKLIGENSEGLGRIAIDLPHLMADRSADFTLFDEDKLFIPRKATTVSIIGEVGQTTTVAFNRNFSVDQYIEMSGGTTEFADEGRIYIVRANGVIVKPGGSMFMFNESDINPGDTIVVPMDVNLRDGLTLWTQITQLVYNSAVAIAALATM